MIRGKGATKQGKYNPLGLPQPGEDEELHALITASSPEDLKVGMDKVQHVALMPYSLPSSFYLSILILLYLSISLSLSLSLSPLLLIFLSLTLTLINAPSLRLTLL